MQADRRQADADQTNVIRVFAGEGGYLTDHQRDWTVEQCRFHGWIEPKERVPRRQVWTDYRVTESGRAAAGLPQTPES